MKKVKLLLLILGIFCLFYDNDVLALEKEESIIEFIGVRQGDNLIPADEDGNVYIEKYERFNFEYKINNVDNFIEDNTIYKIEANYHTIKQYGHEIKNKEYYSKSYNSFPLNKTDNIYFSMYKCETEEKCDGVNSEHTLLDTISITLHFEAYDELNFENSKIEVTEISQGNKVLTPTKMNEHEYKIDINDTEDLKLKIKGENLAENYDYIFQYSVNDKYTFSGKELNSGVELTLSQDEIKKITLNYELNIGGSWGLKNFQTNYLSGPYVEIYKDEEIKTFTTKLKYKNYKNIEVEFRSETINFGDDKYAVSPKYHNKDNELVVLIKGEGYLDQDYDVLVNITDIFDKKLYSKKIKLNGLQINNGYEVVLEDFIMDFPQSFDYDNYNSYKIKTNIGNVTRSIDSYYGYNVALYSNLTYPNGKRSFADNVSGGNDYRMTFNYEAHSKIFEIYDNVYMSYIGKRFENDVIYDYELYYKENEYPEAWNNPTLITKNKISGLKLNTKGLKLEISNPNNYTSAEYVLVIRRNGLIIQIDKSVVEFKHAPSFANIDLESKGKDIYLEINNNIYLATKNAPLNVTLNGIGFTDDVVYEIPLNVKNANDYYLDDPRYFKNYYFTGYELNNGLAKISLNSKDFYDYDDITVGFWAFSDEEGFDGTWYLTFRISYIDSKELFKYVKKYIIDNTLDLIKNITEQTTLESFQKNVEVKDNGSIEIYDKDGKEKVENYIGTGMVARVNNEFEHGLLDMDVVVKGDVTGDGEITITDMIKVRRHLANLNKLEGLYEMAGDTTDTGEITITDLMKLRLDLANIAELE